MEFGHSAAQKEGEEVDEEAGMLADGEVGFVAHLLEPEPQLRIHNDRNQNLLLWLPESLNQNLFGNLDLEDG